MSPDALRLHLAAVDAYTMAKDNALPVPLWDHAGAAIRALANHVREHLDGLERAGAMLDDLARIRPVDPNLPADERPGAQADAMTIWARLKDAGPAGCTGAELAAITPRYGARIHDLRQAEWPIETRREAPRRYRYVMGPCPELRAHVPRRGTVGEC